MTSADKWALAAAMVCITIFATVGSLILPVLTLNLEARGESSTLIGLFGAILGLTAMAAAPFAPKLVRRVGAKRALCGLLLIIAVADLSYKPFEHSLTAWFVIYAIASSAVGLIFVIAETVIVTLAPPSRRGLLLGVYTTGFSFGFAAGPVILRFTGIDGWAPFIIAAGLAIAAAGVVSMAKIKTVPVEPGGRFFRMAKYAPLPFACAFALGAAEMSVYDLLPVYARKIGFNTDAAVGFLMVFSIGTLLMQPLIGVAADRFNSLRMLAFAAILGIAGALALPYLAAEGEGMVLRFILIGIWGGCLMAVYPLGLAQAARVFPTHSLAAANALFGFSYGAGALCGPILTGAAMDITPGGIAFTLALFSTLPLLVMSRSCWRNPVQGGWS